MKKNLTNILLGSLMAISSMGTLPVAAQDVAQAETASSQQTVYMYYEVGTESSREEYTVGSIVTLQEAPAPEEGYRFMGWIMNPDLIGLAPSGTYLPGTTFRLTGFTILRAWYMYDPNWNGEYSYVAAGSVPAGNYVNYQDTGEIPDNIKDLYPNNPGLPGDSQKPEQQPPAEPEPDVPEEPSTPAPGNPFSDVPNGQWFTDYVLEANRLGIMKGSNGTFNLSGNLIRGDLALILWRLAGQPQISGDLPFTDVSPDAYYAEAVLWASKAGVVTSSNEYFNPANPVTRQEFVTMLTRYVENVKNASIENQADIKDYPDYSRISDYARIPFAWAVANNIVNGQLVDGAYYLTPLGNTNRAEAAKMLVSFYNLLEDLID